MRISKLLKNLAFIAFIFILQSDFFSEKALCNPKKTIGLGVMLGEPTGLNLKYWTTGKHAVNFGLAYSFGDYFTFLGDYLWHFPNAITSATRGGVSNEFVPFIGVGGVMFVNSDSHDNHNKHFFQDNGLNSVAVGVRIPLGIEFLPRKLPIGISAELVPGIGIIPSVFGFLQGDIAVRYYF